MTTPYLVANPKRVPIYVEYNGEKIIFPPQGRRVFKLEDSDVERFKKAGLLLAKGG